MDFDLTADQEALRSGLRALLVGRFPMETIRAKERAPGCVDPAGWRELVDAGVFSLRLPEDRGGVGLGMAEAVLVFEELGRSLVPGPLVATHLAAGVVPGSVVGLVDLRAVPLLVEHFEALDTLVLVGDDGIRVVEPDRVEAEPIVRPLDPLTPLHRVTSLPEGEVVGGPMEAARWRLEGACLTAALQLGIAGALCDMAVAYAKERVQFGRPIGSFQAVKHACADMLVRVEVARSAVYAAGVTCDTPDVGDPRRAVASAKTAAGEAAIENGKAAIQVHGGMGFTWDVDAHLYLKRAWLLDTHFGSTGENAEVVAASLVS